LISADLTVGEEVAVFGLVQSVVVASHTPG
jgi:hypothetical protein